jgi:hypothetical protein
MKNNYFLSNLFPNFCSQEKAFLLDQTKNKLNLNVNCEKKNKISPSNKNKIIEQTIYNVNSKKKYK